MAVELIHKLHVTGPEGFAQDLEISIGITTIGRQVGNDIHLDSPQVSRSHAQIISTSTECEINDQGSSNGTSVNGEKIQAKVPTLLASGDLVQIGPFEFKYEQVEVEVPEEIPPVEEKAEPEPKAVQVDLTTPPAKVEKPKPEPEKAPKPEPEKAPEPEPKKTPEPEAEKRPVPEEPVEEKPVETKPKRKRAPKKAAPPSEPPAPPPSEYILEEEEFSIPPGLSIHSSRLLKFLPGIYHTDFMSRFLALFESILIPVEWNIDNFDIYLDPQTAPTGFLPWLANWFEIAYNPTWSEAQRRTLLEEAHEIYGRRGTHWALTRLLEIYLGEAPEIDDSDKDLDPFTFNVKIPVRKRDIDTELVEALIDANKPAHTSYKVTYKR